jgi:hypothetical protein
MSRRPAGDQKSSCMSAYENAELTLPTLSGQLWPVCPLSAQSAKAVVRLVRIAGLPAMPDPHL